MTGLRQKGGDLGWGLSQERGQVFMEQEQLAASFNHSKIMYFIPYWVGILQNRQIPFVIWHICQAARKEVNFLLSCMPFCFEGIYSD